MAEANIELDVRGLNCPQPILRLRAGLNDMAPGQVLQVIATDPGSTRDIVTFCEQTDKTHGVRPYISHLVKCKT